MKDGIRVRARWLILVALGLFILTLLWAAQGRTLPLGIHTLAADDPSLQLVQDIGAQYVVQVFPWRDIEPTRGEFHWEYTDWLLSAADYYHLHVVARLDQVPRWAAPNSTGLNAPPENLNDYGSFVESVAARYRGRISGYIIWNEPNLAREWGNQVPDPAAYTSLLKMAAARIRAADPGARILSAGLAPTNEGGEQSMDDRVFLHAMYAAGAGESFDLLAAHPYPFDHAPDDPRGANGGLNFRRIEDWREIMVANGDAAKPIWITEFGYPTESIPGQEGLRVSETDQARWTAGAYQLARDGMPYVQLFTVWNLTRDPMTLNDQAGFSLVRSDGSLKPSFGLLHSAQKEPPVATYMNRLSSFLLPRAARTAITVLAPDIVIHLGASQLGSPWVPLYLNKSPSLIWTGAFYLNSSEVDGRSWTLIVELMQVNMLDDRLLVNDTAVEPPYLPAEGFGSEWVSARFRIPPNILHGGRNTVTVIDSKLVPGLARQGFTWDNMQIRNVFLTDH